MDCLNLYEENIESFPAVSTPYHNEVIVWWCILFMIFEAHFFPSVLGINELLFPSHVGCDWISRAVRSPSFSSAWRNVLIFVLSKIILTWSRRRSVWNDNISPPPCVADAITDSQLHGDQWMPLFFGCWFFPPDPFCEPSTSTRQTKILWFCGAQVLYAAKYHLHSLPYLNLSSEARSSRFGWGSAIKHSFHSLSLASTG